MIADSRNAFMCYPNAQLDTAAPIDFEVLLNHSPLGSLNEPDQHLHIFAAVLL
jgi:hypothetical protein